MLLLVSSPVDYGMILDGRSREFWPGIDVTGGAHGRTASLRDDPGADVDDPTRCIGKDVGAYLVIRQIMGAAAIEGQLKTLPISQNEREPLLELAKEVPSRVEIMRLVVVSFPLMPHGLPPSTNTALAALDEFFSPDAFS